MISLYLFSHNLLYSKAFAYDNTIPLPAYWVVFESKADTPPVQLSPKSLERRQSKSNLHYGDWYDHPVNSDYIESVIEKGASLRHVSRWLNAVSVTADDKAIGEISKLPFVKGIRRVSSYDRPRNLESSRGNGNNGGIARFDYGFSDNQISMLGIDSLHNLGYSGAGILIGIMDTGFDYSHRIFSDIVAENRIVATYDFINGDTNVTDGPNIQRDHGTRVFSVLAGFDEDSLIGPAYGASFVLAKTEIENQEIQAEEDNWVAAAEWMDSLGVDIISTSLGYIDWYDTTDLDGHTALCTQAANIAVSLGIVVVNAAGNEGNTYWRKVTPPADGDSVIAVGGVSPDGVILAFSSRGPTADGRIKPDFCAQASAVFTASWYGGYGFASGTSFATPLVAGGVALLMEAEPSWVLSDIMQYMKAYSVREPSFVHITPQSVLVGEDLDLRISVDRLPDNEYGWGIPDFNETYNHPDQWYGNDITIEALHLPPNSTFEDSSNGAGYFSFHPEISQVAEDSAVFASMLGTYSDTESVRIIVLERLGRLEAVVAPSPAVDSVVFSISPNNLGMGEISIHDVSGEKVKEIGFDASNGNFIRVVWDGRNDYGKYVASGVYIFNVSLGGSNVTGKFMFVSYR